MERYGALEKYCRLYLNEIKRRLARREGISPEDEIQRRIPEIWEKQETSAPPELLLRILRNGKIRHREFPEAINILKTILEKL